MTTYLPAIPDSALRPLPAAAPAMPGTPADLRIYHTHKTPVGIGPGSPAAAELIWRLMVGMRLHGTWTAVNAAELAKAVLIEQQQTDDSRMVVASRLVIGLRGTGIEHNSLEVIIGRIREALKVLADWQLIVWNPQTQDLYLTPRVFERCQVPATYPDDSLLKI